MPQPGKRSEGEHPCSFQTHHLSQHRSLPLNPLAPFFLMASPNYKGSWEILFWSKIRSLFLWEKECMDVGGMQPSLPWQLYSPEIYFFQFSLSCNPSLCSPSFCFPVSSLFLLPHSLWHPLLCSRPHMPQFHIHNLISPSQPPCEGGINCTYMTDEDIVTQES